MLWVTMIAPNDDDGPVGADEALARLMEGNARFLRGEPRFTRKSMDVLADLVKGQHPFAAILGCSDLRVPPELVFDAKFGDLFVIRVAGNVVSPEVWGSLQYAGTHLNTRLFMVLGHEGCGAVQAALAAKFKGAHERSRIQLLLQNMLPGLEEVDPQLPPEQRLERAVESNVRWSMRRVPRYARRACANGRGADKSCRGGVRDRDRTSATARVAPDALLALSGHRLVHWTCLLLTQSGPRVAGSPCSNHPPFSVLVCADTMPSLERGDGK